MPSSIVTDISSPSWPSAPPAPPAVELCGVAKRFYHYEHRTRSLRELFARSLRRLPVSVRRPAFELGGLDLSVAPGEAVALIGANGSGKSALLRLIAGIYAPSEGRVTVRGRLTAVIELGSGLHPELTGLENIGLYAAVLGLGRREIAALEPAVIEFAELSGSLDVPLKYYSSGMRARLAFSVALASNPDVLVLDEVLAVGDERFRRRCLERLARFRRGGGTLITVSHDLELLRGICTRALWLDGGRARMCGELERVIQHYQQFARARA